ncbi:MAG: gamma-glutamylcyclotransferase family protein, partial [Nitrososphaerota archaeon]
TLKGFRLMFDHYSSSWGGGVADVVESEGEVVYGGAYLLDEEQVRVLDRYEGVPATYNRRKVVVEIEGKSVEAFTYVVNNPRKHVAPTHEYLSRIVNGLKRLGYGEDIISKVRKAAAGK